MCHRPRPPCRGTSASLVDVGTRQVSLKPFHESQTHGGGGDPRRIRSLSRAGRDWGNAGPSSPRRLPPGCGGRGVGGQGRRGEECPGATARLRVCPPPRGPCCETRPRQVPPTFHKAMPAGVPKCHQQPYFCHPRLRFQGWAGPHLPLASVPRASVGLGPCRRRMGRSGPWLLLTVSSRASFAVGTVAGEDPEHGGRGRGGKGRRLDSRIRPSGRHDPRPVREPGAGLLSPVLSVPRLSHQKGCPGGPACALPLRVRSFGAKIRPEDGRGLATAPPPPSSLQGLALSPVGPPGSRRVKCHKA